MEHTPATLKPQAHAHHSHIRPASSSGSPGRSRSSWSPTTRPSSAGKRSTSDSFLNLTASPPSPSPSLHTLSSQDRLQTRPSSYSRRGEGSLSSGEGDRVRTDHRSFLLMEDSSSQTTGSIYGASPEASSHSEFLRSLSRNERAPVRPSSANGPRSGLDTWQSSATSKQNKPRIALVKPAAATASVPDTPVIPARTDSRVFAPDDLRRVRRQEAPPLRISRRSPSNEPGTAPASLCSSPAMPSFSRSNSNTLSVSSAQLSSDASQWRSSLASENTFGGSRDLRSVQGPSEFGQKETQGTLESGLPGALEPSLTGGSSSADTVMRGPAEREHSLAKAGLQQQSSQLSLRDQAELEWAQYTKTRTLFGNRAAAPEPLAKAALCSPPPRAAAATSATTSDQPSSPVATVDSTAQPARLMRNNTAVAGESRRHEQLDKLERLLGEGARAAAMGSPTKLRSPTYDKRRASTGATSPFKDGFALLNTNASGSSPQRNTITLDSESITRADCLTGLRLTQSDGPAEARPSINHSITGSIDHRRSASLLSYASSNSSRPSVDRDSITEPLLVSGSNRRRNKRGSNSSDSPWRHSIALGMLGGEQSHAETQRAARHRSMIINPVKSLPLPETRNEMTLDQRRERLRRTQKLARMLGEEFLGEPEEIIDDSPVDSSALRRRHAHAALARRKSDSVYFRSSSSFDFQRGTGTGSGSCQVDTAFEPSRIRSRTLTAAASDPLTSSRPSSPSYPRGAHTAMSRKERARNAFKGQKEGGAHPMMRTHSDPSAGVSLTPPPLDLNPKAAAVLGLDVGEGYDASPRERLADVVSRHSEASAAVNNLSGHPHLYEKSINAARSSLGSSLANEVQEADARDQEGQQRKATAEREERRKKVAKMSKWLGEAVPVELVAPRLAGDDLLDWLDQDARVLELNDRSLTGLDSGSPTSPGGLGIVAKATGLGKLGRLTSVKRPNKDLSVVVDGPRDAGPALSPRERFANVKRANKLERVFGEAPPQQLYCHHNSVTTPSPTRSRKHAHSVSVPAIPSPQNPFAALPPEADPSGRAYASSPVRQPPRDMTLSRHSSLISIASSGSASYRRSIESLNYLLDHDRELLGEFVSAFDDDDGDAEHDYGQERPGADLARWPRQGQNSHLDPLRGGSSVDLLLDPFGDGDGDGGTMMAARSSGEATGSEANTPMPNRTEFDHDATFPPAASPSTTRRIRHTRSRSDSATSIEMTLHEHEHEHESSMTLSPSLSFSESTLDSPTEPSQPTDFSAQAHDVRRQRAQRAQKLSKFFGAAPPQSLDRFRRAEELPARGLAHVSASSAVLQSSTRDDHPSASASASTPSRPRQRLAPRSAGSAQPQAAFSRMLKSLEDEAREDETLTQAELKEIVDRLSRLRGRGKEVAAYAA